MKSFPAVLFFICSVVIFFQSYHCLQCFQCESSVKRFVPTCLKIVNDEFLKDCKPGYVCSEARNHTELVRGCLSIDESRATFHKYSAPEDFKDINRISVAICNVNGCNDY